MNHAEAAAQFQTDRKRAQWHDRAVMHVRTRRDNAAKDVPEWEALRELAAAIKKHTLSNLADYLEEFERRATEHGIVVHWAEDGAAHNAIVHGLLAKHGVTRVVKSKSMLTEECGLNPYLEERGIEIIDTDLGERIVQLRDESPSHIVMPAIHLTRGDIGVLFHDRLGTPKGEQDPTRLTEAARRHLREKFLGGEAGITGVNFAVAETGEFVVCTNEGNADLGTGLPKLHIACMGIEKIVPRLADLGVFLRLLARSATGQAITTYSSHYSKPRPGHEIHVVIVDDGRSRLLADDHHRSALQCIRCGACLNTCPVYRRSGGHSYGVTVAGPIGSVLAPMRDPERHGSLPKACSLCGSCSDVCPAKVDLHEQLLKWRAELAKHKPRTFERFAMEVTKEVLGSRFAYEKLTALARFALRTLPRSLLERMVPAWAKERALPQAPRESFRQRWERERG